MGIGWEKGWNVGGFRIDGQEAPVLCLVAFPGCSVAEFGFIIHQYPLGIDRDILWGFIEILNISI